MVAHPHSPAYKEVTLQQLRSFYETARLGSLTAAARALGLSHPTVWAQVHSLERQFGTKLLETHRRGCRLTDAGRVLVELAGPSVASIGDLHRRFQEVRAELAPPLRVAAVQRILIEDLPECVAEFRRRYPFIRLLLKEIVTVDAIMAAVESGDVDIGLVTGFHGAPRSPCLLFEPGYELDMILLTPKDHPLARRRQVTPDDLRAYPFVNARGGVPDEAIAAALEKLGVFQVPTRAVEAVYTATARRYVELGFGIALIGGQLSRKPPPHLHQRSMSRYFGRLPIYLVWRRKPTEQEPAGLFAAMLRSFLNPPRPRIRRKPGAYSAQ